MATYLQNVTDFIPQLQPFQPDLNFYANVMQTKQTQYDTNWNSLNKMYSQYYYADLTREDTTEKKESYLKNIDFQLKKVSQLDLSLEQNVNQATQVFKPFYEDKLLMKDMAWTKNKNNQLNRADIFRNSTDEKDKSQYWEEGVRGVNYLTEEFKAATSDEAMSFQNAEYVPRVDVSEKARKIAKDAGISIEKVEFTDGGKFIVKTKNGEALTEPMQKLLEASLGDDPSIESMYKMQAYVDRKDYASVNAAQFGGDKNKAEMKYLENSFNVLKEKSDLRYKQLQANSTVYENNIKDLETQIKNGTASPNAKLMLAQYQMNKDINDKVLTRAEAESKMLNGGQSAAGSGTFVNPYGDLKSLRYKVDNGMASLIMQKRLDEIANVLAYKDMEVDIEANPYKILDEKQKNSMQLLAARESSSMRVAKYKSDLKRQQDIEKEAIENGTAYRDENGNLVQYEDQSIVTTEFEVVGNTTDVGNMRKTSKKISDMTKQEYLDPYFKSTFMVLDKALKFGKITKEKVGQILGYNKNQGITLQQFIDKYDKYGDTWLRKHVGSKGIGKIRNNMNEWVSESRETSLFTDNGSKTPLYKQYRDANMKMQDYMMYIKTDEAWRKNAGKAVTTELVKDGLTNAKFLHDANGNMRTRNEFYAELLKTGNMTPGDLKMLRSKIKDANTQKAWDAALAATAKLNPSSIMGSATSWAVNFIANLDKIGPGNWLASAIDESASKKIDYDYLLSKAGEAYSNAKVIKTPAIRLGSAPVDPGTGLSTTGVSAVSVNPKGFTIGKAKFGEVINDLKNFDWGSSTDRVSVNGIGKDAYDKAGDVNNNLGKAFIDKFTNDMHKPKSSISTFKLKVSPIAGGSGDLSAVIIYPNVEWIKANTAKTKTVNGKVVVTEPGLLMPSQAQAALKNGISYMMDGKKMNSSMYKSSYQSPIEAYVDYHDKYELNSIGGDPMKSFKVEKNKLGTGDYIVTMTYPQYNPDKGIMEKVPYRANYGYIGENLTDIKNSLVNGFMDDIDVQNTLEYNNFEKVNQ